MDMDNNNILGMEMEDMDNVIRENIANVMGNEAEEIDEIAEVYVHAQAENMDIDRGEFMENNVGNFPPEFEERPPRDDIIISENELASFLMLIEDESDRNVRYLGYLEPCLLDSKLIEQLTFVMDVSIINDDNVDVPKRFHIPTNATFDELACTIRYEMGILYRNSEYFLMKDPMNGIHSIIASHEELYKHAMLDGLDFNIYQDCMIYIRNFFVRYNNTGKYINGKDRFTRDKNIYTITSEELILKKAVNNSEKQRHIDLMREMCGVS